MLETEVLIKNCQQEVVNQKRLIEAVEKSLQAEGYSGQVEISILLVDNSRMQELNKEYRGLDRPTDVLSFSQLEGESVGIDEEPFALGDIIISVETAARQAVEKAHSLDKELDLLAIHGVLHLIGYNDETEEQAVLMHKHEKGILEELNNERRT